MIARSAADEYEPWARSAKVDPAGVRTLEEFSDAVRAFVGLAGGHQALFRGESSYFGETRCQPLLRRHEQFDSFRPLSDVLTSVPGAGRREDVASVLLREEAHILDRFRQWFVSTRPESATPPPFSSDWLALAQHYGAPTRLLDVTRFPLTALFFACWTRSSVCDETEDGLVYLTNGRSSVRFQTARRSDFVSGSEVDPEIQQGISDNYLDFFEPWTFSSSYPGVTVRYRPVAAAGEANRRLTAQSGEFVWWRDVTKAAQWFPIRVPGDAKPDLLRVLDRLHINPDALFPDEPLLQQQFDQWALGGEPAPQASESAFGWEWPGDDHWSYAGLVQR